MHAQFTLAALAVAFAMPAMAADQVDRGPAPRNEPMQSAAGRTTSATTAVKQLRGFGGASVGDVRVALVWDYELGVLRSKGVTQVRNPAAGLYCILPSTLTSTAVKKAVPVVSADYGLSSGKALIATVYTGTRCKSTEFGVQTIRGDSGSFLVSDFVGFNFIVD